MMSSGGRGGGGGSSAANTGKNILLKVILLGDGGVGKSCLMNRFVSNRFDPTSFHTIGVEFLNKEIQVNGQLYTIQIWDTAGQERFKSLRTPFYRGSDICLLTFSIDDRVSFQNLATWKEEFLYYADVNDKANFPFVVIGNKVDIEPEKRQVAYETALDWCAANGNLPYVETSAKDATNVVLAFQSAVEKWSKFDSRMEHRPYSGATVNLGTRQILSQTQRDGGGQNGSGNGSGAACCF